MLGQGLGEPQSMIKFTIGAFLYRVSCPLETQAYMLQD
jgi:hypothetical protein